MIDAVLPHMRVASLADWAGDPGEAFYAAFKHALTGYTEALREDRSRSDGW